MATPTYPLQAQQHTQLPIRPEPFFPRASQLELYTEMDRCAALLMIETQEFQRIQASPSATPNSSCPTQRPTDNAEELYGAMLQLADRLHQVTHDLHYHHQRRGLGQATRTALAPTKKIEKKHPQHREPSQRTNARSCAQCGRTSSSAWRRGPDYLLLCNPCGLQYNKAKNITRSMSVLAVLNRLPGA